VSFQSLQIQTHIKIWNAFRNSALSQKWGKKERDLSRKKLDCAVARLETCPMKTL